MADDWHEPEPGTPGPKRPSWVAAIGVGILVWLVLGIALVVVEVAAGTRMPQAITGGLLPAAAITAAIWYRTRR